MKNEIKNKDANMRLMRMISELKDGEYNVSTSKGKFKIEKSEIRSVWNMEAYKSKNILITDEKGVPFSQYYNCHQCIYNEIDMDIEKEGDYSPELNLDYGYEIDCKKATVHIYTNKEHTSFYTIGETSIAFSDEEKEEQRVALIINNIIENLDDDIPFSIDLNNFERIIKINDKEIRISKDKDIIEEINKYKHEIEQLNNYLDKINQEMNNHIEKNEYLNKVIDKDFLKFKDGETLDISSLDYSGIKQEENKLIELSKLYAKAMEVLNYTHNLDLMTKIAIGLNPEFKKLPKKEICDKKETIVAKELDEKLQELKCGIYFVNIDSFRILQIDIFPDGYRISTEDGNVCKDIPNPIWRAWILKGVGEILHSQTKEDMEEEIKSLTRRLAKL